MQAKIFDICEVIRGIHAEISQDASSTAAFVNLNVKDAVESQMLMCKDGTIFINQPRDITDQKSKDAYNLMWNHVIEENCCIAATNDEFNTLWVKFDTQGMQNLGALSRAVDLQLKILTWFGIDTASCYCDFFPADRDLIKDVTDAFGTAIGIPDESEIFQ